MMIIQVIKEKDRRKAKNSNNRQPQIVECVNCFKTFDLNLRSLDQAIISDDKFCFSCFNLIMQQEYDNDDHTF